MQRYRHIFGPVPSRRLGRSLGVDLTPLKTCTLDCVFCQLGHTSHKTIERREYMPAAEVKSELSRWHEEGGQADHITLSGSGEPTLHSGFCDILTFIKKKIPFPAVLLSNGTLFWLADVREAALPAEIVKLSLSAWDPISFRQINRPHPELNFHLYIAGLRTFRKMFSGKLWLEVFLVEGVNISPEGVKHIARIAETIAPDEIHLNTAVRPPAERSVLPVDQGSMEERAELFRPRATIIAGFPTRCGANIEANENSIMDMLRRRPCTSRQIANAFDMHVNEVSKYIGDLSRSHRVHSEYRDGEIYFKAGNGKEGPASS
ncbi:MAG: radical SAM protein [Verrucomicrobia bacterium]|nr:radical SAM protein [Verrucomicrobiota bacterium]